MKTKLLIDSIVQQVTVLIAQLATSGGIKQPLAHIANQVFVDLAREIESQGVSRKVAADMFGVSLRSYRRKMQRCCESATERGRTVWEAVLDFLRSNKVVTRRQLFDRFPNDDEEMVSSILHDLVESGLVFRTGCGTDCIYRAATDDELESIDKIDPFDPRAGVSELVWSLVFSKGPIQRSKLMASSSIAADLLDPVVDELVENGLINVETRDDGEYLYAEHFLIDPNSRVGWEASVYDHFRAVVRTICTRLQASSSPERLRNAIGGSTYTFDVGPGHPCEDEVLGLLADLRRRCSELRQRVACHNEQHGQSDGGERVVVYFGESAILRDDAEEVREARP